MNLHLGVTDIWRRSGGRWVCVHEHSSLPIDLATGKAEFLQSICEHDANVGQAARESAYASVGMNRENAVGRRFALFEQVMSDFASPKSLSIRDQARIALDDREVRVSGDDAATLRMLKARADINDVLVRLARGLDRCDRTLALLLSRGRLGRTWQLQRFRGGIRRPGDRDADRAIHLDLALYRERLYRTGRRYGRSRTHVQVSMRFERDGALFDLLGCGRYLDRFACRAGAWKIVHPAGGRGLESDRPRQGNRRCRTGRGTEARHAQSR